MSYLPPEIQKKIIAEIDYINGLACLSNLRPEEYDSIVQPGQLNEVLQPIPYYLLLQKYNIPIVNENLQKYPQPTLPPPFSFP